MLQRYLLLCPRRCLGRRGSLTEHINSNGAVPLESNGEGRGRLTTRTITKHWHVNNNRQLGLRATNETKVVRQYGESTSFMLCAFSRENQPIRSGVRRPDWTLSMSLRCHSRLNAQSSASSTTPISTPLCADRLDPREADVFWDDMANLSVHRDTANDTLQAGGRRVRSKSPRVPSESLRYERVMRRASRKRMTVAVWCPEWSAAS